MKVLYICPTSEFYGDGKALLNIIPKLIKSGVEPVFVTPFSGTFSDKVRELGLECIICNFGSWTTYKGRLSLFIIMGFLYHYLIELRSYRHLRKTIKKLRPDIIHSNSTTTSIGYRLAKDLKIPHVWHIREYGLLDHGWNHFPTKSSFEHRFVSLNNYSISITPSVYNYNNHPNNGIVIYDGVFDTDRIPVIRESDDYYFLYVGRVIESKGVMELVKTYKQYAEKKTSPCILKIVGDGCLIPSLEKWIYDNGMTNYIELLGYKSNVGELMSRAKALIVPSPNEAFGFITAEAMFNGCPVIGKDSAGTKMQFDNCYNIMGKDIAYRYQSQSELLTFLNTVCGIERKDILGMLKDAQDCVIRLYSTSTSANSVYNYYTKILSL